MSAKELSAVALAAAAEVYAGVLVTARPFGQFGPNYKQLQTIVEVDAPDGVRAAALAIAEEMKAAGVTCFVPLPLPVAVESVGRCDRNDGLSIRVVEVFTMCDGGQWDPNCHRGARMVYHVSMAGYS